MPPLLKSLVSMLINGQDISASESSQSQASSTISQLIYFNAKSKCKEVSSQRHAKDHEPPFLFIWVYKSTRLQEVRPSLILFMLLALASIISV